MTRYEAAEAADKLRRLAARREADPRAKWMYASMDDDLPTARALQELAEWIEEGLLPQGQEVAEEENR